MKQYKITSENILKDSSDDCYLSPDDPIHELKIAQYLGGLGAAERLANYKMGNSRRIQDREHGSITTSSQSRFRKLI